jgi:hypothetical protein
LPNGKEKARCRILDVSEKDGHTQEEEKEGWVGGWGGEGKEKIYGAKERVGERERRIRQMARFHDCREKGRHKTYLE